MFVRLPLESQTLYAGLLEQLLGEAAKRSLGQLRGGFVSKTINGEAYVYFQASTPGGRTRQFYVGRKSSSLDKLVARFARERVRFESDRMRVRRLAAQLRIGGINVTDNASARVMRALSESGVFAAGGVVVGTHAFVLLGNLLGVCWQRGALQTRDGDVAQVAQVARDLDLDIAVTASPVDVPSVLTRLKMGFVPVPPLDSKQPSTSFKVRGQALRVALLCPGESAVADPIFVARFGAAAQPLPFLEYLLETNEHAVAIAGEASLVSLPAPARFAFHKLLLAPLRAAAFATKAENDLAQAIDLLEVLLEDRPGDLPFAWQALLDRGAHWRKAAERGLQRLRRRRPALHARLRAVLAEAGRICSA